MNIQIVESQLNVNWDHYRHLVFNGITIQNEKFSRKKLHSLDLNFRYISCIHLSEVTYSRDNTFFNKIMWMEWEIVLFFFDFIISEFFHAWNEDFFKMQNMLRLILSEFFLKYFLFWFLISFRVELIVVKWCNWHLIDLTSANC